jgi:Ca2+-binding RTX toxin-like protein
VITTANDVPGRDPASYQIYGFSAGSWQLLTSGSLQLPAARLSDGASVVLPDLPMLTQYRVIFPTLKGSGQMMQIAELKLYGVTEDVSTNNILAAGLGADTFRFDSAINAPATLDTLTNFNPINDRIELENAVFTALTFPGPLAGTAFGIGAVATNADQRILYNSLSGTVSYDEDGNGPWAALPFAQLPPGLAMNAGVFTVI